MDAVFIYLLRDPTNDAVRYVGQSLNPFARRRGHISHPASKLRDWIAALQIDNRIPALQIIEETTKGEADAREIFWIHYYSNRGCKLLNSNHLPDPEPLIPKFRRVEMEERDGRTVGQILRAIG